MTGGVLTSGKGSGPLPCAADDPTTDHCVGDCSHMAGNYFGADFPRCPVRMLSEQRHLQSVFRLRRAARLSALSPWPDGYSAWVVDVWGMVEDKRDERINQESG